MILLRVLRALRGDILSRYNLHIHSKNECIGSLPFSEQTPSAPNIECELPRGRKAERLTSLRSADS